jgi:hypothetical protein
MVARGSTTLYWPQVTQNATSHNPEVAGSNPAPATRKAGDGAFLSLNHDRQGRLLPNSCLWLTRCACLCPRRVSLSLVPVRTERSDVIDGRLQLTARKRGSRSCDDQSESRIRDKRLPVEPYASGLSQSPQECSQPRVIVVWRGVASPSAKQFANSGWHRVLDGHTPRAGRTLPSRNRQSAAANCPVPHSH